MPINDISGLTPEEGAKKKQIEEGLKKYFSQRLGVSENGTDVNFIGDNTDAQKHVMVRMYSKSFTRMNASEIEGICDHVVTIVEEIAGHPYHEAFPIPVLAIKGRPYRKSSTSECAVHYSIEHMQSVTGKCPGCGEQ